VPLVLPAPPAPVLPHAQFARPWSDFFATT